MLLAVKKWNIEVIREHPGKMAWMKCKGGQGMIYDVTSQAVLLRYQLL